MVNSAYPDQTESALFAFVILSETLVYEILGHLSYRLFREGCQDSA